MSRPNYDRSTAAEKPWFAWASGGFSRLLRGPAALGRDRRTVVVDPPYRARASSGFDPVAYFTDRTAAARPAGLRIDHRRRHLAVPERGQPRGLRRPSRTSTCRALAATIRSRSRAAPRCPGHPLFWAVVASGFICSIRGGARGLSGRSRRRHRVWPSANGRRSSRTIGPLASRARAPDRPRR